MDTVLTNNKGYMRFDLQETVRETAWALARTAAPTVEKNSRFAAVLSKYDPRIAVVVYPFADDCGGWATLVNHSSLGDVIATDLPWEPSGSIV